MPRLYTPAEARTALAVLRPLLDEIVVLRADAAEIAAAVEGGRPTELGGMAELKAAEARVSELASQVTADDVQLKGFAPLLLDFPGELDGEPVLLCWLEGEAELGWYHRLDLGFLGRRPLPDSLRA